MKTSGIFAVLFLVIFLMSPATAPAAGFSRFGPIQVWDSLYSSARSHALGRSDVAVLEGPTAVFDNPGLIVAREGLEVGYDQYDYISGIDLKNFGLSFRTGRLALLAGVKTLGIYAPITTAFAPEGTGEYFDVDNRVYSFGLAYDLAPLILDNPHATWTLGLAYRLSTASLNDVSDSQGDFDLGTTFRWRQPMDGTLVELSAAGAYTNVQGNSLEEALVISELSQTLRYGLGLKVGLGLGRYDRDGLTFTVGTTWINRRNDFYDDTGFNYGFETIIYHLVALRTGHEDLLFGGVESFGAGLLLEDLIPGPVGLRIDYSNAEPGTLAAYPDEGHQETFSLNASWAF